MSKTIMRFGKGLSTVKNCTLTEGMKKDMRVNYGLRNGIRKEIQENQKEKEEKVKKER